MVVLFMNTKVSTILALTKVCSLDTPPPPRTDTQSNVTHNPLSWGICAKYFEVGFVFSKGHDRTCTTYYICFPGYDYLVSLWNCQ